MSDLIVTVTGTRSDGARGTRSWKRSGLNAFQLQRELERVWNVFRTRCECKEERVFC